MVDHPVKDLYPGVRRCYSKGRFKCQFRLHFHGVGVENERAHFQYVGLNAIAAAATVGVGVSCKGKPSYGIKVGHTP